jgi:hypothetical protein
MRHVEVTTTNPKIKLQLSRVSAGKTNHVLPSRRKNHRIPITLKHQAATEQPNPSNHPNDKEPQNSPNQPAKSTIAEGLIHRRNHQSTLMKE